MSELKYVKLFEDFDEKNDFEDFDEKNDIDQFYLNLFKKSKKIGGFKDKG